MERQKRALIVDDDSLIQQTLSHLLSPGFETLIAQDGPQALEIASREKPDAILLDIHLGEMDGIQTCRALRQNAGTQHTPIIMITGTKDEEARCQALLAGANDLVSKPFRSRELLVRLNRQLSSSQPTTPAPTPEAEETLEIGNLILHRPSLTARIDGARVELSMLEFHLVDYLARNQGRILSRESIAAEVWPEKQATGRAVDARIAALRRKLEGFDHQIVSMYRAGYQLTPRPEIRKS